MQVTITTKIYTNNRENPTKKRPIEDNRTLEKKTNKYAHSLQKYENLINKWGYIIRGLRAHLGTTYLAFVESVLKCTCILKNVKKSGKKREKVGKSDVLKSCT